MKKTALLSFVILFAACHDGPQKRGAINLGNQPTAITLVTTNNDLDLRADHTSTGTVIKLTPASGGSTITGIDSSAFDDGDLFMVRNESTTDNITFSNSSSSSAANNRMLLSSGADVVLPPKSAMWIELDSRAGSGSTPRWVQGPGHINSPTFNGTITTSNASFGVGQETKTSGALSLSSKSFVSVTATVAFTLANGTVAGQRKEIECSVAASSPLGTLTIATPAGSEPATHVFTAVGQALTLEWNGTGWHVIKKTRAGHQTLVIGTTLTAGLDMAYTYDLSVTGAVASSTTKALPDGLVAGEVCHLDVTTAATSAAGQIFFTGESATGVNVGSAVNIGNGGTDKSFVLALQWDGARWQIIYLGTNTGVTIAQGDVFELMRHLAANDNIIESLSEIAA